MTSNGEKLRKIISDCGEDLLKPCESTDELLLRLDDFDHLMTHIVQAIRDSVAPALQPAKEALMSSAFVNHDDVRVRVSAASCMAEIIRIAAPVEPFEESQMKIFFQIANVAYGDLPCMDGLVYTKALSIIQNISHCQSCVLMLDLEFDELITEMFRLFLSGIRAEHPTAISSSMEKIMTVIIHKTMDCDEVLVLELTKILLASLKKDNQNISPTSFKLANKVFEDSVEYLEKYLPEAVTSLGIPVACYADTVSSFCHEAGIDYSRPGEGCQATNDGLPNLLEDNKIVGSTNDENLNENWGKSPSSDHDQHENQGSPKHMPCESKPEDAPTLRKRIRIKNSLTNPQEGYDYLWTSGGSSSINDSREDIRKKRVGNQSTSRKTNKTKTRVGKRQESSANVPVVEKMRSESIGSKNQTRDSAVKIQERSSGRKRPSTKVGPTEKSVGKSIINADQDQDQALASKSLKEKAQLGKGYNRRQKSKSTGSKKKASKDNRSGNELVGSKIKVWWPLDEMFYEGKVASFDPSSKMHQVDYDDGEIEILDLTEERWQLIHDDDEQKTITTAPSASADTSSDPERKSSDLLTLEERWSLMLD